MTCNRRSGSRGAQVLAANSAIQIYCLNWIPKRAPLRNSVSHGYRLFRRAASATATAKDVAAARGSTEWRHGLRISYWGGQFRALRKDAIASPASLETQLARRRDAGRIPRQLCGAKELHAAGIL